MEVAKETFNNFLLISGSGRNCGKTQLAEKIITETKAKLEVTAVKISSHFHEHPKNYFPLEETGRYKIYQETKSGQKDSGRFLAAGASKVFYIECPGDNLSNLSVFFYNLKKSGVPVIIESGGLRKYLTPAVTVFVTNQEMGANKEKCFNQSAADIIYDGAGQYLTKKIQFESGLWRIIK